ncbi:hypothetical protein FHW69_000323 [Luteibacter sp. Sphag1AF]|uniref:hypothetical protein n=1 Tax=Luteibacter sp. Sphag1AF TaxID=2587031 RepID=UPI00161FEADF|nr:hypothetical protein [Luteibacter sp. Sphag1AF]MBB3225733.1 hypothetical protein [Luteibacter sp. Sphag1AF]
MQRKTLLASAATLLLAGSTTFAFAQDGTPPPPPPASQSAANHAMPPKGGPKGGQHGDRGGQHGWGGHHGMREQGGVIGDLRGLERLYIMQGRAKELPALYNEVLAKSQNPRVRDYAYSHLARAQMQPGNADAAIATLRKSLDENLANDAKRHAAMEQWRAQRANGQAPSTAK